MLKEVLKEAEKVQRGPALDTPPHSLWTITEVADYLRVSVATVRRWTNTGQLRCYRVGGNRERRFEREAVLTFMRAS
jgi:excisionase family DNA binding protein